MAAHRKRWSFRDWDKFWLGIVVGVILGAPLGVLAKYIADEVRIPDYYEAPLIPADPEQILAMKRIQRYLRDHPDPTLDELDALTPERLAELYPEIQ